MPKELASDRVEEWLASVENLPGWEGNSIGYGTAVTQLQEQGLTEKGAEERLAELRYFGWLDVVLLPDGHRILATPKLMERVLRRETRSKLAASMTPHWDAGRRELWLGSQRVKSVRAIAESVLAVLNEFERQGWPPSIDDPNWDRSLNTSDEGYYTYVNKGATIDSLNERAVGMWFHGADETKKIGWSLGQKPPGGKRASTSPKKPAKAKKSTFGKKSRKK